jgi:hypothetical protein
MHLTPWNKGASSAIIVCPLYVHYPSIICPQWQIQIT